jgi:ribose transport system permease protein
MAGRSVLFLVQRLQGVVSLLVLVLLAACFASSRSTFFQTDAIANIAGQVAVPGSLAVGMTFVILTGGIDLSVGSMCALLSVIAARWAESGTSLPVTASYVLLVGSLLGALNGLLVSMTRLQPFVVTLAAMVSLRGVAHLYSENHNISGFPPIFAPFQSAWGPVPVQAMLLIGMVSVSWILLTKTPFGRRVYAIGGNEDAAFLSGVRVRATKVAAYAINGVCVGVAALVLVSRTNNGEPGGAGGYELDAIAAVVVGGASLVGGVGSIWGTLFGAVFIQTLSLLMILWSIPDKLALGLKGPIILLAVWLQSIGRR